MAEKRKEKRLSPIRIALRVLGGILGVLLLFLLTMFLIPVFQNGDHAAVEGSADWMAPLDDSLPLNAIVMPGTHDSGTQFCQLGYFSKCQGKNIGEQLEAGYRYLDIRLAVDGESMRLMHGFTGCRTGVLPWTEKLSLENVLEQCYVFLAEHPTETVVFAVKQEHGDESVAEFEVTLNRILQREPEFWLLCDTVPTLGEARGKLVLLRRYADEAGLGETAGIPLVWANQNGHDDTSLNTVKEEQGTYTLWVQDRYEYDTEDKWTAFSDGMEKAGSGEEELAIHFLSTKGTAAYGHPWSFAKVLNTRLEKQQKLSGWIVVDYGSASLAEAIYRNNLP